MLESMKNDLRVNGDGSVTSVLGQREMGSYEGYGLEDFGDGGKYFLAQNNVYALPVPCTLRNLEGDSSLALLLLPHVLGIQSGVVVSFEIGMVVLCH